MKTMMVGVVQQLSSKFRVTFNMVLNLLRVEHFQIKDMIQRSFWEIENQRRMPETKQLLTEVKKKLQDIEDIACIKSEHGDIDNYYQKVAKIKVINLELEIRFKENKNAFAVFSPGRIIEVSDKGKVVDFVMVISVDKSKRKKKKSNLPGEERQRDSEVYFRVLHAFDPLHPEYNPSIPYEVLEVSFFSVMFISNKVIKVSRTEHK